MTGVKKENNKKGYGIILHLPQKAVSRKHKRIHNSMGKGDPSYELREKKPQVLFSGNLQIRVLNV